MNLKTMNDSNPDAIILVRVADLKEFAICFANEVMAAQREVQVEESYLSPDDVSQMVGVSKNTLWRWEKGSYLKPIKVGRKSRYRLSDVKKVLEGRK